MGIRTPEEAVQAALATTRNVPRMCQAVTRGWFGAPSVGDFDGDGAADAEDGWKHEPAWAKHSGDRKPPRGYPVTYSGGSADNWHRAISLGPIGFGGEYMIRTTDGDGMGVTDTVPLDYPERVWGMPYLGWSETISGFTIPKPMPPAPVVRTRGKTIDKVLASLRRRARKSGQRENGIIVSAIDRLTKIKARTKKR